MFSFAPADVNDNLALFKTQVTDARLDLASGIAFGECR
jgi:hypothetical protein